MLARAAELQVQSTAEGLGGGSDPKMLSCCVPMRNRPSRAESSRNRAHTEPLGTSHCHQGRKETSEGTGGDSRPPSGKILGGTTIEVFRGFAGWVTEREQVLGRGSLRAETQRSGYHEEWDTLERLE